MIRGKTIPTAFATKIKVMVNTLNTDDIVVSYQGVKRAIGRERYALQKARSMSINDKNFIEEKRKAIRLLKKVKLDLQKLLGICETQPKEQK